MFKSPLFDTVKESRTLYKLYTKYNRNFIGSVSRDVDGFFYFWPDSTNGGCYSECFLKDIHDMLKELNKKWNKRIEREWNKQIKKGHVCTKH